MSRPASVVSTNLAPSASVFEGELDHVYRTLRRLGAQPAEAEDLAQDVFVVAWRRWSDYQPDRPLRAWLAGIAHHVARDHFRKHSRREVATEEIEQEDGRPGPEDQLSSSRARRLALQALALLPERHRSILIQHELEGLNIREIAEQQSVPFFTAAGRLRRARLRFAETVRRLQQRGDPRLALLSAQVVLEAERLVPALPGPVRARILLRLGQGGAVAATAGPAILPGLAGRSLPLVPAASALVALVTVLALPSWRRAPDSTAASRAPEVLDVVVDNGRPSSRTLGPPRLLLERPPVAVAPSATALDPARPPTQGGARGLVAHWRFEDAPGSDVAVDSSGRGHVCFLRDLDRNAAWVKGRVGGALDLGRTGWLECPLPEVRAGVPIELSVAVWIKQERRRPFSVLFTRQLPTGKNAALFWFGLREDLLTVWSSSWAGWTNSMLESLEEPGWTHVAFVHAGRDTSLYVDGVLVRHKTGQLPRGEGLVQGALTIGSARFSPQPGRAQHHFDGAVDEAMVYDRPLTAAEVAALAKP